MVATEVPSVDLVPAFARAGVTGAVRSGKVYYHPKATGETLDAEIVYALLSSGRTFTVKGTTSGTAEANLWANVAARKGVIEFAADRRYGFDASSTQRMNDDFWQRTPDGTWEVKPDVDRREALRDIRRRPERYAIPCGQATAVVMEGGGGVTDLTPKMGARPVNLGDWVPGSAGYILNENFKGRPAGNEGENIIYVGFGKFWGHTPSGALYRTLVDWANFVKSWDGRATVLDTRVFPDAGLVT